MITINDLNKSENFFLMAGPCVIEGEDMALRIAEKIVGITERLHIPYVFKGSYRKANRSRLDSFTGIGDEKALKILRKVGETFNIPTVTDIHETTEAAREAIDYLVANGEKVGLVAVHLYRPFSAKHFLAAVPKTAKKIAISLR